MCICMYMIMFMFRFKCVCICVCKRLIQNAQNCCCIYNYKSKYYLNIHENMYSTAIM